MVVPACSALLAIYILGSNILVQSEVVSAVEAEATEKETRELREALAAKDAQLAKKDAQLAKKSARVADLEKSLKEKEKELKKLLKAPSPSTQSSSSGGGGGGARAAARDAGKQESERSLSVGRCKLEPDLKAPGFKP